MRIGELARATGVDTETIRYYEKIGLLPEPARSSNRYRAYDNTHLERLAFIRHCRALDMGLVDVKRLLDFAQRPDADCGDINRLIDLQMERVRARRLSLEVLERQLAELRSRCADNRTADQCGILQELVAAANGEACICHPL